MVMGGRGESDFADEREILYKVLFDLKSDMHEIKRMLMELGGGYAHTGHDTTQPQSHVTGLLQPPTYHAHEAQDTIGEEVFEEPLRPLSKEEKLRDDIVRALRHNGGKRKEAAKELFMSERTLYRKINELNIDVKNL